MLVDATATGRQAARKGALISVDAVPVSTNLDKLPSGLDP